MSGLFDPFINLVMPDEHHPDPQEAIREKGVVIFSLFGACAGIYSAIKWYGQSIPEVGHAALALVAATIGAILFIKQRTFRPLFCANISVAGMAALVLTLIYQIGGIDSAHILWVVGLVIFAYLLTDRRSGMIWAGITFVYTLMLIIGHRSGFEFPNHELNQTQTMINDYSGYLLPLFLLWCAQAYGTKIREQALENAQQALSDAKALSEKSTEMSENLGEIITQAGSNSETLLQASDQLSKTVESMAETSRNICQRVDQQASASTGITQTLSNMAASVQNSTEVMSNIRDETSRSEERVARSAEAMQQAIKNMAQIKESNQGIATAMGVISDIADQTNLLALNAAIEAARAGEQGRGFSVVADEVRTLSVKSNESARQIRDLLIKAETDVKEGAGAVNEAGDTLTDVVVSVQDITRKISQVTDVMFQQNTDIEGIVRSSESVTQVSKENSESGQALTEGAEALSEVADKLAEMASRMHQLVNSQ